VRCCGILCSHANRGGSDQGCCFLEGLGPIAQRVKITRGNELPDEKRLVTRLLHVPDI